MDTATGSALKVRCERADLLTALQAADAVVPSTSAKPILTNLQLAAGKDGLEILATDLQVGLRAVLRRLETEAAGQVVLPARQLVGILKESRSPTVKLQLEQEEGRSQVRLDLADGDYQLPAVIGETFPSVSSFPDEGVRITVPGETLERMIRKVSFAVDRDRTSAVLSGVSIAVGEGELVLAATNGMVLAEAVETGDSYQLPEAIQAIVPAATISHLSRILQTAKPEAVEIAIAGKLVFVRVTVASGEAGGAGNIQVELTSRLVEGSYPAYRNALPTASQTKASFRADELASAVRRTALMTSSASRGIILDLAADEAVLSNLNNTSGSARIPISCSYQGAGEKLGINAQYLADVLRVFDGDELSMELNGAGKGVIIREEAGVTFLVMPLRLPS